MRLRSWALLLLAGCASRLAYDQEDGDAAPLYAALAADVPEVPAPVEPFIFSLHGDAAAAAQALEPFEERLALFTRAARARRCRWPAWDPLGDPPANVSLRDIQLLCARIHVRFALGRRAESLEDACTLLKAGFDGLHGPSILSVLHGGIAILSAEASLQRTFLARGFSSRERDELHRHVRWLKVRMPSGRRCMQGEREAWDSLAASMAKGGYVDGLRRAIRAVDPGGAGPPMIPEPLVSRLELLVRRDPERTRRVFLATWEERWRPLLEAYDRPPTDVPPGVKPTPERRNRVIRSIVEALALDTAGDATLAELAELTSWLFLPPLLPARKSFAYWNLSIQGLDLACRIDHFEQTRGRYPGRLAEIADVPPDPFTGGALPYRTGVLDDGRAWYALTTEGPRRDADERLRSFIEGGFSYGRFELEWEGATTFMVWGVKAP